MTELEEVEVDDVDLAVVAYLVDGEWELDDLPDHALERVSDVAVELRRYPDPGALALISVGEDFALLVRLDEDDTLLVLSDVTAATEWGLARSAAEYLGVQVDPDDDPGAAGDLGLLADLGLSALDLAALVDDEPYPEDLLVSIADELGFGDDLEDLLDDDEDDEQDDEQQDDEQQDDGE